MKSNFLLTWTLLISPMICFWRGVGRDQSNYACQDWGLLGQVQNVEIAAQGGGRERSLFVLTVSSENFQPQTKGPFCFYVFKFGNRQDRLI